MLLLALANSAQAQFTYSMNNGAISIASYTGAGGAVTVPGTINGLPVAGIGSNAFENCSNLTSVTIPDSVIDIGAGAFANCGHLTDVTIGSPVTIIGAFPAAGGAGLTGFTIPNGITNLGGGIFGLDALTNVTVPPGVTNIGSSAFYIYFAGGSANAAANFLTIGAGAFTSCVRLANMQVLKSVAGIGDGAFYFCTSLTGIHFVGDAPSVGRNVFASDNATNYFLPGATGWSSTFADLPAAEWTPPSPMILTSSPGFGAQTSGFGFTIRGANNASVVVQTCTNLSNPVWMPLATKTLTGGASYFSDPQWAKDTAVFYRLAPP